MLQGQVFKGQVFENQVFAVFINTFLDGKNGVIQNYKNGMKVTAATNSLTIQSGVICIQGRFLEEDTSTTIEVSNNTAYNKLVLEIDLNKENTETDFNQAYYKIVSATTSYPTLNQDDIVGTNSGIYQYELARFRTTINGITDFTETKEYIDFEGIYAEIQKHIDEIDDGSLFATKNDLNTAKIPIGSGIDYYGSTAPEGFLFADGSAISRTEYSALFNVIGTIYGAGDGSTTFNLPDKRSRVSAMVNSTDSNFNMLGKQIGSSKYTLTVKNLASHKHEFKGTPSSHSHSTTTVQAKSDGISSADGVNRYDFTADTSTGTTSITPSGTITETGNNEAFSLIQPTIVCNYIIRVK